ncbi:MAG: PEP-CTERM sorting domain-containing protein [Akkermansiaceae bacterium]|nr:PEP-CTERM sorting domain-containing protein [Akkermansiaceae bacterium]
MLRWHHSFTWAGVCYAENIDSNPLTPISAAPSGSLIDDIGTLRYRLGSIVTSWTMTNTVPEPSSILMGLISTGFFFFRRR